jgi:hypothetical protein
MYKKYNFEPKSLSPYQARLSGGLKSILEKLAPMLIIAATFAFLWK